MSAIGRTSNKASRQSGFSLLEMLVALAIVSIVAVGSTLALPNWQARATLAKVETGIDEALSLARAAAKRTGVPHRVSFAADRVTMVGFSQAWSRKLPPGVELSVLSAREAGGARQPAIAFFADGSSTGGIVTVQVGGRSVSRRISWINGQVEDGS